MIRATFIFLTLLVSLFCGTAVSGADSGRRIVLEERVWFSLHLKVTGGAGHITGFRYDGLARKARTLWDEGNAVQRTGQATFDGVVRLLRADLMSYGNSELLSVV